MHYFSKSHNFFVRLALSIALAGVWFVISASAAHADIIYVGDDSGNVGRYDTTTNTGSFVGSLAGNSFEVGQVIGLAYDPLTASILVLDRDVPQVYSMNSLTGVTVSLFDPGFSFQGGAVKNNILYGINEEDQTVEAFSLATFADQGLNAPALSIHSHALGVNPVSGQLYSGDNDDGSIYNVDDDGSEGSTVVVADTFTEDLDYYQGNFLAATYDSSLYLINGTTGVSSEFLSESQTAEMGLTGSISGVAVQSSAPEPSPVPEPGTMALMGVGLASLIGARRRKKNGEKIEQEL